MVILLLACAAPSGESADSSREDTARDSAEDSGGDTQHHSGDPPDADGDGYAWSDAVDPDCDDAEASVHPWAREVPYDGVDQDCDGADLVDADADGYLPTVLGGDDCDDFAAGTHPGATEYCDLADEDCDGDPLPDGVCAGAQDVRDMFVCGKCLYSWRSN